MFQTSPTDSFRSFDWDDLASIEQPSRYIGSEPNHIRKNPDEIKLFFALAFPELYEIGMSHFGMQILYHVLNKQPDIAAERVFAPGIDMHRLLIEKNRPLVSLESKRPLHRFDIIGFSLLYELTYTNVLYMLESGRIPIDARQRTESDPLVIAGGPCTVNPEPMARFFDAMVIGDGEEVILALAREWMQWKAGGQHPKRDLLERWRRIDGVYVPSMFEPTYTLQGHQVLTPTESGYTQVRRAIVPDLDQADFPDTPIVPFGKPVHDRLRLEISRGCTRGCRFCQAGMIYRPVRERSVSTLMAQARSAIDATGYEDISLLSLSTGDYTQLSPLMERLMGFCEPRHVAVSLPSIRADRLSRELMEAIKRVRKTGFTIAAEAGSQRLRRVVNKNLHQDEIIRAVQDAFALGWQVIKLYFMIGLPTETQADIEAIIDLAKTLRQLRRAVGTKRRGELHISLATFIPKPHTPFQWASQLDIDQANSVLRDIRDRLHHPGMTVKWQNPELSFLEGALARGDRRLSDVIEIAYRKGCRFDGWSDHFRFDLWMNAFQEAGIDPGFFLYRHRTPEEPLPWDHIDTRVSRDYLSAEWEKAITEEPTFDCREGACQQCGVCNFSSIAPKLGDTGTQRPDFTPQAKDPLADLSRDDRWTTVCIRFTKLGPARFLGHLELYNLFCRSFRKAAIAIEHSGGFHPKPRLSFDEALPIGMESMCESFIASIAPGIACSDIISRLNPALVEGVSVTECEVVPTKKFPAHAGSVYRVKLRDHEFDPDCLERFQQAPEVTVSRTNRKGITRIFNLKSIVDRIEVVSSQECELQLLKAGDVVLRPSDILHHIWAFDEKAIRSASVIKLRYVG
jgi:radical SAM family uncharacterized protein/radical SAM-linked protein